MTRMQMTAAALTVGLLSWGGVALAQAADIDVTAASETVTAAGVTTEYLVEDAGSVTLSFDGTSVELVDQVANPGWSASVDSISATEIEIDFVGTDRVLRFDAEVEDGEVKVEIEDRTLVDDDSESEDVTETTITETTIEVTDPTVIETTANVPDDDNSDDEDSDDDNSDDDNSDDEASDDEDESVNDSITGTQTIEVTGYGTITVNVSASGLEFVSATGIDGWTAQLDESDDHEVTVVFTKDETTVKAELKIEDGSLRLRVEVED